MKNKWLLTLRIWKIYQLNFNRQIEFVNHKQENKSKLINNLHFTSAVDFTVGMCWWCSSNLLSTTNVLFYAQIKTRALFFLYLSLFYQTRVHNLSFHNQWLSPSRRLFYLHSYVWILFSKQQNFIYEEEEEKQTKPMSRIMISDDDSIGHVFSFMSNKRKKRRWWR